MSERTNNIISGLICFVCLSLLYIVNLNINSRSITEPSDNNKIKTAVADIIQLARKVSAYSNEKGYLPRSLAQLTPDYISPVPQDPYGRAYTMINNGAEKAFIYFYGKDGRTKGFSEVDGDWAVRVEKVNSKFQVVYN